jgi:proline dehydrogenase
VLLRALFISLSESRSLRGIAERSAIGRKISTRFVAGNEVDDALRAARALNDAGPSPTTNSRPTSASSSPTWAST